MDPRLRKWAQIRLITGAQYVSIWFPWWEEDQEIQQNELETVNNPEVPSDAEWKSPDRGRRHSAWSLRVGSSVPKREEQCQRQNNAGHRNSPDGITQNWVHILTLSIINSWKNLVLHSLKFPFSHLEKGWLGGLKKILLHKILTWHWHLRNRNCCFNVINKKSGWTRNKGGKKSKKTNITALSTV